ncbi:MAG: DUF4085 family protein [Gemmataceae bacterium]|nr:DUF4085 family protein [Gemmataceae bacterium]
MKHFTPERYLRLRSLDDRATFLAAHEEWERALQMYHEQLQRVRDELPTDLQQLVATVYLHDARVLDMWWGGRSQFGITLHPESDPARLVVLTYSLVERPTVTPDLLPEAVRSEPVAWLYDELDFAKDGFTHNILLSDGREVELHFRTVTVKRPVPLVPAMRAGGDLTPVRHPA